MSLRKLHPLTVMMVFFFCGLPMVGCSANHAQEDGGQDAQDDGGQEISPSEDGQSEQATAIDSAAESAECIDDSSSNCSFQVLPAGGSQEVCGLRLMIPPNAVGEPTNILVTRPALNVKVPASMLS